jgi:hypothetical protein
MRQYCQNDSQEIAQGAVTPRTFLKRRPDLLFTHCEHHYIFYLQSKNSANPIILAVLHRYRKNKPPSPYGPDVLKAGSIVKHGDN